MNRRLIERFQLTGAVHDLPRSGRPRSTRIEENIGRALNHTKE